MLDFSEPKLAKKSPVFRYIYYIVSGFRLKSFRAWSKEGEPNPFAAKSYRAVRTERVEFVNIFDDLLDDNRK